MSSESSTLLNKKSYYMEVIALAQSGGHIEAVHKTVRTSIHHTNAQQPNEL